jgi:hypothetical protein
LSAGFLGFAKEVDFMRKLWMGPVSLVVAVLTCAGLAGAQTPAPVAPMVPGAPAVAEQKGGEQHDQVLRLALATARVRALTAAIEFNAIRLILANLNNDQPVLDALNQTLTYLTNDQNQGQTQGQLPKPGAEPDKTAPGPTSKAPASTKPTPSAGTP